MGRWPDPASLAFHLRRVLEHYRIDLVLDVGAHVGEYAQVLRREARYRGDIISFEPAADAFSTLKQHATRDPRWRVERVALGDVSGTAQLQHYHHTTLNSIRRPSQFGSDVWHLCADEAEDVEVSRLDEFDLSLARYSAPLLKVDTQGFDLEVIRGAGGIVDRVVAVQLEVPMIPLYEGAANFSTIIGELEAMGFSVSGLFPVAHDPKLRAVEFDCVAVRVEA